MRTVGNAGAREERRGGESASAGPLLGPLGPRGAQLRKQLVRFVSSRRETGAGPKQGTTWLAAGCLGNLTTRQREAAQSRIHGRGRAVRMACPRVVMALQKSVGDVLAQRSAGDSLLSRGEAAFAWPGA
jgi:hypothetical protein